MSHNTTIIRNSARCLKCGEEIESRSRHDFVTCKCGALSVDGGHSYIRRVFSSSDAFVDTSETENSQPVIDFKESRA